MGFWNALKSTVPGLSTVSKGVSSVGGALGGAPGALWGGIKSTLGGQASFRPGYQELDQTVANQDRLAANQARANQSYLAGQLRQQIEGQGPSVAVQQGQEQIGQAIAGANRMAANARGVNRGMAQRNALYAGLDAAAQGARGAAQLRSQEQLDAQAQMRSVLESQRQQDLAQRGLSLEAARANQAAYGLQQGQQAELAGGNAARAQKGFGAAASFLSPLLLGGR